MTGCCAFGCSNHPEDGKKHFAIPNTKAKKARRKAWLQRIGRKGFTPSRTSRLCEVRRITFNALENIRQLLAIARIQMSTKLNLFLLALLGRHTRPHAGPGRSAIAASLKGDCATTGDVFQLFQHLRCGFAMLSGLLGSNCCPVIRL